ncbi:helix-turn-helix domain-containing protein [uncultured Methylophaga sp.]|uniref:helix-turn-helix domain-containing protein n=1 Tax=uncultured Methylophaga sp. TaxID=285271 RepID=UPI00259CD9AE|nr:helix-turn-helix domain-containing protein [uncultured Methylophaga sp.]|tara:strand:- start:34404 stop:34976 length:573 start_codon:yes stop_codon:yes gene_type:complete
MPNDISNARTQSGLSQSEFAQALHISARTLQEWEQGRRKPSGSARALINIAVKHPEIIRENFEEQQKKQTRASQVLDTMTSHILSKDEIAFSDLILDWYREGLECSSVPRPTDNEALRLAVKASILERLVEVLNSPPHNENHSTPSWCKSIGSLEKPVKLQSDRLLEDEQYCLAFEKRNLFVVSNFMFFI